MKLNKFIYLSILIAQFLLFIIALSSCGHVVKEDPGNSYTDTNYLSVESKLCGNFSSDINECYVKENQDISNLNLFVQAVYTGEIQVLSSSCNINFNLRYGLHENIKIPLKNIYNKKSLLRQDSCTFTIILKPDVIKDSKVKMFPRIGKFYIEVLKSGIKEFSPLKPIQAMESTSLLPEKTLKLPIKENGEFQLADCENNLIKGNVVNGNFTLPKLNRKISCKYQIGIKTSNNKFIFVYYINVFTRKTTILPNPKLTVKNDQICADSSEDTTTFISINNKWKNGNSICAKKEKENIIRVYTVKRNVIIKE